MMDNPLIIVMGMALVTYLPRLFPMAFLSEINLPPFWDRFLNLVPYTVLAALIFPGILFSTDSLESAVFGAVIAVILAIKKASLLVVVIGGILGVMFLEMLF